MFRNIEKFGVNKVNLVERDYKIMSEIERWRFCLSRHIKFLGGFDGQRACDKRLKLLIEAGYIGRKKVLYGVPSVYYLTHKGKALIGVNKRQDKIRIDRIPHDIAVVDTGIYFMLNHDIKLEEITTEKEINSLAGFGNRKHQPDFIIEKDRVKKCVEIELTLKATARFKEIVEENYLAYDTQFWIVAKTGLKIKKLLEEFQLSYSNIEIIKYEGVQEVVKLK